MRKGELDEKDLCCKEKAGKIRKERELQSAKQLGSNPERLNISVGIAHVRHGPFIGRRWRVPGLITSSKHPPTLFSNRRCKESQSPWEHPTPSVPLAFFESASASIDRLNEVVEIPKIGAYGQNGCFSFPNAQNPAPQRDYTQFTTYQNCFL